MYTTDLVETKISELGITGTRPFKLIESATRRTQTVTGSPYLGAFDSFRFYDACTKSLSHCDVVHERNTLFSVGAAMAARRLKRPYVLSLDADEILELDYRDQPLRGIRRIAAQRMAQFTYTTANAITCVSPAAKRHFVAKWGIPADKIYVIPNGVDVSSFQQPAINIASQPSFASNGKQTVMFVGGFWHWHGLDLLVDSFRDVAARVPNVQLVLVGDGPTRSALEERVAKQGLNEKVIFTGSVAHTMIPALLATANICVAPYPHFSVEFWMSPMKIYEYMAAGKALVAADIGLISEVIRDRETGRLVSPGDAQALANVLAELLLDPAQQKQLGENAQQKAILEHSWERYIAQLEALYSDVIK